MSFTPPTQSPSRARRSYESSLEYHRWTVDNSESRFYQIHVNRHNRVLAEITKLFDPYLVASAKYLKGTQYTIAIQITFISTRTRVG